MSLKLIPIEEGAKNSGREETSSGKKQKHFNPGQKLGGKGTAKNGSLKTICLSLVHFINRGSKYTHEQIEEVIISMQHGILALQKKKQETMRNKDRNKNKKHK